MQEFARTPMGQRFFEGTLPRLADALTDIAKSLKARQAADSGAGLLEKMQDESRYAALHPIPDSQFREHPTQCPHCASKRMESDPPQVVATSVLQVLRCLDCRRSWSMHFVLLGYIGRKD